MKKYINILQSSNIYYTFLSILLIAIGFNFKIFFIFALVFIYVFRKKVNFNIIIITTLILVLYFLLIKSINLSANINGNFLITNKQVYQYQTTYTIKRGLFKYKVNLKEDFKIGSYIFIKGTTIKFDELRVPKGFNSYQYHMSIGIVGKIKVEEIINLNKSNFVYLLSIKNYNNLDIFIKMLFSSNDTNSELYKNLLELNLLHLFKLSGIHIYAILSFLNYLYNKVDLSSKYQLILKFIVLILLLMISTYSITIIRIIIYESLKEINAKFNYKISNFTILNIAYLILLVSSPFNMININILVMYLISISLSLLKPIYSKDRFILKSYKISIIVNLILLPFYNKINIFSIFIGPLIISIVIFILIPVSVLSLLIGWNFFEANKLFNNLINYLSNNNFNMIFGKINYFLILLYFILFILYFITKNKGKIIIVIFMILIILSPKLFIKFKESSLYFLDVGQGDSAVYLSNNLVIVIDAYNSVEDFLNNHGIKTIDYLILSHSDLDHINEANNLLNKFVVNNTIINPYDEYNLIYYSNNNIIKASSDYLLKIKELILEFYGPIRNYDNSNNNSLVFKLIFDNNSFLFTGDVMLDAEVDLVNKYNYSLSSHYLKVAHHGSKTSSSSSFINLVSPKVSIISVGLNNQYNLPSSEVVERLANNGSLVYQTSTFKTIIFRRKKFLFMA